MAGLILKLLASELSSTHIHSSRSSIGRTCRSNCGPLSLSSCNLGLLSQPETNKMPKSIIAVLIYITYTLKHQAFDPTKGYPGEGPDLRILSVNIQGAHTFPEKYIQLINYAQHRDNKYDIYVFKKLTQKLQTGYETY